MLHGLDTLNFISFVLLKELTFYIWTWRGIIMCPSQTAFSLHLQNTTGSLGASSTRESGGGAAKG